MAKSSLKDLYPISIGKEISLRQEFLNTFAGTIREISKSRPCLLRTMRKDTNGKKIPCDCVDKVSREPDKESICPICLAEAYLWDETENEVYRAISSPKETSFPPGLSNTPIVVFYMRHNTEVTNDDKIVEILLDDEGNIVKPFQRIDIYRIQHVEQYRLDEARIEYLKLWTYREDVKHLNV